jgi:acyl-CoA synthetase (AMP-forming)/AMP-acid ligase II
MDLQQHQKDSMRAQTQGRTDLSLLEQTIGENFEAIVRRFPDNEALVMPHQNIRWTYRQLNAEVDRVGLLARGLQTGDRIGIWAPNVVEWVLVQFSTAKIGAILVSINPAYRAHELAYALRQSGCSSLVAARRLKSSDYVKMLAEVAARMASLTPNDPINIQYTSAAPPARPRAPRCRATISSTTAISSASAAATRTRIASVSRCRSTTASAWFWATSAVFLTAPPW